MAKKRLSVIACRNIKGIRGIGARPGLVKPKVAFMMDMGSLYKEIRCYLPRDLHYEGCPDREMPIGAEDLKKKIGTKMNKESCGGLIPVKVWPIIINVI